MEKDQSVASGAHQAVVEGKVEYRRNGIFLEAYVAERKPPVLIATARASIVLNNRAYGRAFRAFCALIAASIAI